MKGFNWKWKEINWKCKDFNWKWKDFNWKVGCQIARAAASKSTKCKMYDYVLQNRKQPKESLRRKTGATWQQPAATSSSQQQSATEQQIDKNVNELFFAAKKKKDHTGTAENHWNKDEKTEKVSREGAKNQWFFQKWKSTKKCFYRKKRQQQQSSRFGGSSFSHGEIEVMFQKHCKTQ